MAENLRCAYRVFTQNRYVMWEVTHYCNLTCAHCLAHSGPHVSREGDMTTDEILAAVMDMLDHGVDEFLFHGGEPLALPGFIDMLAQIPADRAYVRLGTTGYFVRPGDGERLRGSAVRLVALSLDGDTPEVNTIIRGKHAHFERTVTAIKEFIGAGLEVRVNHMLHPGNMHRLREFILLMRDLGVQHVVLTPIYNLGRATEHPELQLTAEQREECRVVLDGLKAEFQSDSMRINHLLEVDTSPSAGVPDGCPGGTRAFLVLPNGDVSLCSYAARVDGERFIFGNVKRDRFADIVVRGAAVADGIRHLAPHCPMPEYTERRHVLELAPA